VTLHYAFQTRGNLFLILEYIQGGELFMMLEREGILEERQSKLYLAQISLALGHLHNLGIIFRDLKPENIMISADGYIKLIDFGLCKERVDDGNRTFTYCGTIEYMAPEVISKRGHDCSADWWSLGALMFDMLTGLPPFLADSKRETQQLVLHGSIKLPAYLSPEAKDLLRKLLQRNQKNRLGGGGQDYLEIIKHSWFREIDIDLLLRKELPVLYRPASQLTGPEDVSLFDRRFINVSISQESPSSTPNGHDQFHGFTYTGDHHIGSYERQLKLQDQYENAVERRQRLFHENNAKKYERPQRVEPATQMQH